MSYQGKVYSAGDPRLPSGTFTGSSGFGQGYGATPYGGVMVAPSQTGAYNAIMAEFRTAQTQGRAYYDKGTNTFVFDGSGGYKYKYYATNAKFEILKSGSSTSSSSSSSSPTYASVGTSAVSTGTTSKPKIQISPSQVQSWLPVVGDLIKTASDVIPYVGIGAGGGPLDQATLNQYAPDYAPKRTFPMWLPIALLVGVVAVGGAVFLSKRKKGGK